MEETVIGIIIITLIAVVIAIAIGSEKQTKEYVQSCRDAGGVPIDSGSKYSKYNCWSNEEKGYIDIK